MFPTEIFSMKTNQQNLLRILGVVFEKKFHILLTYVSAVWSSYFCHIRDLLHFHHYRDVDSVKLLANALVSSRLDYCNSLLYGIVNTDLTKLQHIQNRLARFVAT